MNIVKSADERLQLDDGSAIQQIATDQIKPNPYQPRKTFDDDKLDDLSRSIQQHGILQPIVLRTTITGYHIVVGERRFRAAKRAELTQVPAIVKSLSDEDMMELAIIENLQREDLNVIEEAESYRKLMDDLQLTQQQVAQRLSKSRPYIANMLRLLHLPSTVMRMIQQGELSGAHGRTLLALKSTTEITKLAKRAHREAWSVRYLEQYISDNKSPQENHKQQDTNTKPKFIKQQERQLKEQYGTNVAITTKKNKGQITFEFTSEAEFKRLVQELNEKYKN